MAFGCDDSTLSPLQKGAAIVSPPKAKLLVKDYCPRLGYEFSDFWVIGRSTLIENREILRDWDRDGIPDVRDNLAEFGISSYDSDSNADGYSDLLIFRAGFDTQSQSFLRPCSDFDDDLDGDGLTDCEENYLTHTAVDRWDSDGDGIPDYLELRAGLNPLDASDSMQNPAGDGLSNLKKVKLNLPIMEDSTEFAAEFAYQYRAEFVADNCYRFTVDNIPLLSMSNGNLIDLYFFERSNEGLRALRVIPLVVDYSIPDHNKHGETVRELAYTEGDITEWYVQ